MYSTFLILFYGCIIISFILLKISTSRSNSERNFLRLPFILSIIIITLFVGLREYVGRDFQTYLELYDSLSLDDFGLGNRFKIEYSYFLLVQLCRILDLGVEGFFVLSAFITILLLYNLFRNQKDLLPYAILLFFFSYPYAFVINGVRQAISIFAFLNGAKYLDADNKSKHRFFKFILWLLIGSSFHSFSLILIFLYWLFNNSIIRNCSSVVLSSILLSGVAFNVLNLASVIVNVLSSSPLAAYILFISYMNDDRFTMQVGGIGLASVITIVFYVIIFSQYKKIASLYPQYRVYFVLMAIGAALYYMFPGNMLMERVAYYFLFSEIVVIPLFIKSSYQYHSSVFKLISIIIIVWFVCLFHIDLPSLFENQMNPMSTIMGINI